MAMKDCSSPNPVGKVGCLLLPYSDKFQMPGYRVLLYASPPFFLSIYLFQCDIFSLLRIIHAGCVGRGLLLPDIVLWCVDLGSACVS